MSTHMRRISVFQAKRGIYLDFEGFKDKSPTMAGFSIDNTFRQVVFDPQLKSAADAKSLPVVKLKGFVKGLLDECEASNKFIIAFSTHELQVIQEYCDIDISGRYKNALKFAKRWKWRFHRDVDLEKNSLDQFLKLPGIDYEVPKYLGKGNATKRLKAVTEMLGKRGEYSKLTAVAKAKWTKLLDYNRHDVLSLEALTLHAAKDMER